jgi:hypothetical protein
MEAGMNASIRALLVAAVGLLLIAPPHAGAQDVAAEQQATPAVDSAQLEAYGQAYLAIGELRDQYQADAAAPENKKAEAIDALQAQLRADVAAVLEENGLTDEDYTRITYLISTDIETRRAFNAIVDIEEEEPEEEPSITMSDNPHIGHVMDSFADTPGNRGLLPVAREEADVALQHAGLAAAALDDLASMKTHTGHVVHAVQPEEGSRGPGAGYGFKKAIDGVATHADLAAKAEGASDAVRTHAVHVVTAARTASERADRIIELAAQIDAATSAADAAPLVEQLEVLVEQLIAGEDADGDGSIGWQQGEGGLDHVEQHMALMMGG